MGISIKREETEKLAREVAKLKGESLTDAIHHALESELARLEKAQKSPDQIRAELAAFFARADARGPGNGKSLQEIEAEMYGEYGEPI
jgi:antitoxin VapB